MASTRVTRSARPPGPAGRRLTGNALLYDLDRIGFLQQAQLTYGDCFSFDASTVVVCDPDVVHDIFVRTNTDFLAEGALFAGKLDVQGTVDMALDWMTVRRHGARGFHRSVASAHASRLLTSFDRTLRRTQGALVDVNDLMQSFSGIAVSDYCLGGDAGDVPQIIGANVRAVLPLLDSSAAPLKWIPSRRTRRFLNARRRTEAIISEAVRNRRLQGYCGPPRDLLDQMIGLDDPALDDGHLVEFIRVNLLASFGVPGATMSWIVRELATDDDIRRRVYDEARVWARLPTAVPTLADLPYTEAFVKEMLRAYPPTWLMGRIVARTTSVAGWQLQRGDNVMFSPYLIHRDARWWSEPERILPQRWLGPQPSCHPRAYFPFGAGPRVCLGVNLGTLQLVLATSWLAYAYDTDVADGAAAVGSPRALLVPDGLRARFVARTGPWRETDA